MKHTKAAILNSLEAAGAQVIDDSTAEHWSVVKDTTDNEVILGPIPYGATVSMEVISSKAEQRQLVLIGAGSTAETVAAETRYGIYVIEDGHYESQRKGKQVFAYTTGASIPADADDARAEVYDVLVSKVNAYDGVNVAAYPLTKADFTAGTSAGDAAENFTIGETVTQETSSNTAKVAKCVIDSGTMAGDDAAGAIWLYDVELDGWLTSEADLTGGTSSIVVTVTNATTVHSAGIAILDDAGYYVSKLERGGASGVGIHAGFSDAVPEIAISHQYAFGIGSVMKTLAPVYDNTKSNVIRGEELYNFENNMEADASKTYTAFVFTIKGGEKDALGNLTMTGEHQLVLFADESNSTNLSNFDSALDGVI